MPSFFLNSVYIIVKIFFNMIQIKGYDIAVELSIVILNLLNEMLNENSTTTSNVPVNQQNSNEHKMEIETKTKFSQLIREIPFIAVKPIINIIIIYGLNVTLKNIYLFYYIDYRNTQIK